jgi:hypothetical protein
MPAASIPESGRRAVWRAVWIVREQIHRSHGGCAFGAFRICKRSADVPIFSSRSARQEKEATVTNRRHWLYALLALAGGFIGGTIAIQLAPGESMAAAKAATMRVVRAEKFVLADRSGTQRGVMQVADGTSSLALNDGDGRNRAELHVRKEGGSSVTFYDQAGNRRIEVGQSPSGRAGLAIFAAGGGRQIAAVSAAGNGETGFTLYDPTTGRARAGLGVAADGEPALVLFDQNGKDRAELHIAAHGKPGLALADENGKTVAALPPGQ